MIFIVADQEDRPVIAVRKELEKRGEACCLFDTSAFPYDCKYSHFFDTSADTGPRLRGSPSLDLSSVRSVWNRRPVPLRDTEALSKEDKKICTP
jgi:hypothetical protein